MNTLSSEHHTLENTFNRSAKFSLIKHENKHADASEKIINVS